MNLFGFSFKKQESSFAAPQTTIPIPRAPEDGEIVISAGGFQGQYLAGIGETFSGMTESELILNYRSAAEQPECDSAISDIVDEAIAAGGKQVTLDMDRADFLAEDVKQKIHEEFRKVTSLLDFNATATDIFRRWYVDGRLFYHIVIDKNNTKNGIAEMRPIDPLRIRKIREVKTDLENGTRTPIERVVDEYYVYSDAYAPQAGSSILNVQSGTNAGGLKIAVDSVVYVTSGLMDPTRRRVLSYLQKALKPLNQLRMMEDALVIYRITRAPERRIFYVDVGNLPKGKAEEYVQGIMNKYRNKSVYDACFSMDTKVPLLDGRTLSLAEISAEFYAGKRLWAYSCDPKTGMFAPGLITSAGVTRKNEPVMKITLDNGKEIICTHDHKFPTWERGITEAKDLVIGDSMIPFYTRKKAIIKGKNTYEQLFKNDTKKWEYTHRLTSKWKDANDLINEYTFNQSYAGEKKGTVHHVNYSRYDNTPENVVRMNQLDHFEFHKQHCSAAGKIGGKVTHARRKAAGIPQFIMTPAQKAKSIEVCRTLGKIQGRRSVLNKTGIHGLTPDETKANGKVGSMKLCELLKSDAAFNASFGSAISAGWGVEQREAAGARGKARPHSHFCKMAELGNTSRWNGETGKKHRCNLINAQSTFIPDEIRNVIKKTAASGMKAPAIAEHVNSVCDLSEFRTVNRKKNIKNRRNNFDTFTVKDVVRVARSYGCNNFTEFAESVKHHNHKIAKIEFLTERIDVGTLSIDRMEEYHNYHTYALDAGIYTCNSTGEVRDDRRHMSMLEDFWLPRREGGKGTEITTLPGGTNLSEISDVTYFRQKFHRSLNVPESRSSSESTYSYGKDNTEIAREEVRFQKFIDKLRKKFSQLLLDTLKVQLVLRNIITIEEWPKIVETLTVDFGRDNYFVELKEAEILKKRMETLDSIDPRVGIYFSKNWVRRNILKQTDEEIKIMDEEIFSEKNAGEIADTGPLNADEDKQEDAPTEDVVDTEPVVNEPENVTRDEPAQPMQRI